MARTTPHACAGVLHEPSTNTTIQLDSPAWYAWLAEEPHRSFHFTHPSGGFTARKEHKQRGQDYWVAYRHVHTKLYKTYLGKSEQLTEARLRAASQLLAGRINPVQSGEPPVEVVCVSDPTSEELATDA